MTSLPPPDPSSSLPPLLPSMPSNAGLDAHLRRSLAVLRDRTEDPGLRERIDEVIRGRSSLRALARDPAFGTMMEPLVTAGMQRVSELSAQERRAAEEGARAFERGQDPGAPSRPEPNPGTW